MGDSEEDESMREVMVIVKMFDRMIGQALDALHAVDFEIPSYEELAEEFIRAVTEFKEVSQEWLHHIIHTADSYAEELEEYIFENEVLIRAITESYSTISERVTVAWTKIQTIMNTKKIESMEYSQDLLYSMIGKFVVLDLQNGEIEYELPIKREFMILVDLLRNFDMESTPAKIFELFEKSTLRSLFYQARALYSPRYMSARLNGLATMIGGSSFMTFDKKTFDLTGTGCQYLLARDFLNKDFAVAVNYDSASDPSKKSIIFADQVDQVEIKDKIVLVNNKPATLPLSLKSIKVHREGDVITVSRSTGAVLKCDVVMDVCTFKISPFYAGRTMGLWGTFTNEIADDMMEPSGKFSKDLNTFINSWKLNKSCKDNIITSTEQADKTTLVYDRECSKLFRDETSVLSDCFGVVSPTPYYEMCIKSVAPKAKQSFARTAMLQSIAGAYSTACKRFGFELPSAA